MEHLTWDEIWTYVDQNRFDAAKSTAEEHIQQCPVCAQKLRTAQRASGALVQRLQIPGRDSSSDADRRLLQALSNAPGVMDALRRTTSGAGKAPGADGESGTGETPRASGTSGVGRRRVVRTRYYTFMGAAAALVVVAWTGAWLLQAGHSGQASSTASSTDSSATAGHGAAVTGSTAGGSTASTAGSATGSGTESSPAGMTGATNSPIKVVAPKHGASMNGSAENGSSMQGQVSNPADTKSAATTLDMELNVQVQDAGGMSMSGARVAFVAQGQILASGVTKDDGLTDPLQIRIPTTPTGESNSGLANMNPGDVVMIVWKDGLQPLVADDVRTWAGITGSTITAILQPATHPGIQIFPNAVGAATLSQSEAWALYQWASQQVH